MDPELMDATGKTLDGRKHTASLEHAAKFAPWASPHKNASTGAGTQGRDGGENLQTQASGTTASGSPAGTANRGQLNPHLSRWLMGYPEVWDECAQRVTVKGKKANH